MSLDVFYLAEIVSKLQNKLSANYIGIALKDPVGQIRAHNLPYREYRVFTAMLLRLLSLAVTRLSGYIITLIKSDRYKYTEKKVFFIILIRSKQIRFSSFFSFN